MAETAHPRGGRAAQLAMPRSLTIREVRVPIKQPGFRTREIIVVTTLLDPLEYTKEEATEKRLAPSFGRQHFQPETEFGRIHL